MSSNPIIMRGRGANALWRSGPASVATAMPSRKQAVAARLRAGSADAKHSIRLPYGVIVYPSLTRKGLECRTRESG